MSSGPRRDPEPEATPRPDRRAGEVDVHPQVLVVDDEPLVRRLICSALSRLGWRTLEAGDGAEALLIGADTDIDLLVTDYQMPGVTGIELADAFRGRVPNLPVVVVSGLEAVGELASSRGHRFLAKPFDPSELSALVAGLWLGRSIAPTSPRAVLSGVPRSIEETRVRPAPAKQRGRYGPYLGWTSPPLRDDGARPIGASRCTLLCFPKDDARFATEANTILSESMVTARTWAGALEQVRLRIERAYPAATIHPRSLLAVDGDPNELWYCYRDGGFLPSTDG